ncbi:MAG: protein-disulfide reductase DsbD family protein [Flavihumibacter sp.]
MKKISATLLLLVAVVFAFAQSDKQVKWTFETKKVSADTYEVHMIAEVGGNYHIYSQHAGDGPLPTSFDFTKNPLLTLAGQVKENGKMVKKFEDAFKSDVRYFEKSVTFVQQVKVKGKAKTNLAGKVEFMVCNDHECLPPSTVNFKVAVGG